MTTTTTNVGQKNWEVISVSDQGNEATPLPNVADIARASNIAMSLRKFGMDPLDFIPFHSAHDVSPKSSAGRTDWQISQTDRQKYMALFRRVDTGSKGTIEGSIAKEVLLKSGLSQNLLGLIWEMSDINSDGRLNEVEFVIAMHLSTQCKKGKLLPNSLPDELHDQLVPGKEAAPPATVPELHVHPITEWKYSRTYLNDDMSMRNNIEDVVEQSEEELRHIRSMCAQIEKDIRRMTDELEKRKCVVTELCKEKQVLTEAKQSLSETRKKVNIDKVTLSRDRAKLQSEIIHLKELLREGTTDVQVLRQNATEAAIDLERIVSQTITHTTHRNEAARQHVEEMDKIEFEQRETAGLVDSFTRMTRDEEIKLESERILRQKSALVDEMQQLPRDNNLQYPATESNKWATTLLSTKFPSHDSQPKFGFGTRFFQD